MSAYKLLEKHARQLEGESADGPAARGGATHAEAVAAHCRAGPAGSTATSPVAVGGHVYVGSSEGTLYALDESTGAVDLVGEHRRGPYRRRKYGLVCPMSAMAAAEGLLMYRRGRRSWPTESMEIEVAGYQGEMTLQNAGPRVAIW